MSYLLLTLLYILFSCKGFSQQQLPLDEQHFTDSLGNILQSKTSDSSKAMANYLLSEYYKFKDTAKSKTYLTQGQQLSQNYPYLKALYHFYEGQYYYNWNTAKASVSFLKAAELLSSFHDKAAASARASSWFDYALMNKNEKGYEFVVDIILNRSLPIVTASGDSAMLAHYYSQLATLFMSNYQFAKAEEYNNKAISLLENTHSTSSTLLFAYLGGVSIYMYQAKSDPAKILLDKAKALLEPFPESANYPLYYYNEALYYTGKQDFDKALTAVDKGTVLAKKYNQTQIYQQFYFRKYNIYSISEQYAKAKEVLNAVINEGQLMANINDRATIYSEMAKTNEALHDYKEAYSWLSKYRAATDSIQNNQTKVKISELEARYNASEKQHKIDILQSQNNEAALKSKNDQLYKWALGLGCLTLLIISGAIAVSARNNKKLATQKEINYQQELKDLEQKHQLKITKAMLDGEEQERERVARDLHDGLGGMLAGVKMGLSGWANNNTDIMHDGDLNRIIRQLDSSVGELRRIARNMMPETLLKFGLEVALKDLCAFYNRDDLYIEFQPFSIEPGIALSVQLNIYRIVQELLSNAIKHSGAANIVLQCSQNNGQFFITVEDDGVGFDIATLTDKKGMGLDNLKNRIEFLKGKFEILSTRNEGTTINIELNTNANG
ncbi:tetratricopeptide repeat-containing sensor histidine kinase [Taibaiella soli]|nr:ATP-binding protein [Taibaiella soli]